MGWKKRALRAEQRANDLNAELFYARRDRDDALTEVKRREAVIRGLDDTVDRLRTRLLAIGDHALHSKDHAKRRLEKIKELVR